MQNSTTNDLHKEHEEWMGDLTLWHNELMFYDQLLLRLAAQDVPEEDTEKMEEFKSRFDIMQEKLGNMRVSIQEHERVLQDGASNQNDTHSQMRDQMKGFDKEFKFLKNEFFLFTDKEDY